MANYAQMNPGKYHLGYRFPTPVIVEKLPMHAEDEYRIELKYNHAVTVNRTLYVGNVQVFARRRGSIKVEGDSMYKSVVNEFDIFPSYNKIEAAVNDGEEITGLAEFADKILQFKQNTLYVINVSRQIEVLESTHKHKGVSNPAAICKTDYGIAWANHHGCYLYDGRKVVDLLEKGGIRRIKESIWSSFVSSDGVMIGYFPQKRQIIVVRDARASFILTGSINVTGTNVNVPGTGTKYLTELSIGDNIVVSGETRTIASITNDTTATVTAAWGSDLSDDTSPDCNPRGDIFIYDMITSSWSNASSSFASAIKSNFITDWNGDLVHATSLTPKKWSDASAVSSAVDFQTKDIDFGHPSVRKKIYKVYLTYQGDASNVEINYGVDGLAPTGTFYAITSGTDGSTSGAVNGSDNDKCIAYDAGTDDWLKAELKPSASINNVSSFRLKISGDGSNNIAADFQINDISIIYRIKNIK